MEVSITNFKSIGKTQIKLGRVTIFLGPPAAGKSNLLEAIALAGYFDRYVFYNDVEPLSRLARVTDIRYLFGYGAKDIEIKLDAGKWRHLLQISICEQLDFDLNGITIPINECHSNCLFTYNGRQYGVDMSTVKDLLITHREDILVRLYGFDRFRENIANSMVNGVEVETPYELLRDDGKNFGVVAMTQQELLRNLNAELKELSQAEIILLDDGRVALYDGHVATKPPESLMRIMYYLVGLSSAASFADLNGVKGRSIVLLEEPEGPPRLLYLMVKYIEKFSEVGYTVISTYNPILVSMLRDKFDATLYYVYRGDRGFTEVAELDKDKLAEELTTSEDILFMRPHEVLRFAKH